MRTRPSALWPTAFCFAAYDQSRSEDLETVWTGKGWGEEGDGYGDGSGHDVDLRISDRTGDENGHDNVNGDEQLMGIGDREEEAGGVRG